MRMALVTGRTSQNRYRVISLLGKGGMGAVYRAWDTRLGVPVALKEMTPQPGIDPHTLAQLRQQFEREAKVLARLKHPHLVGVGDFFEEKSNDYLVMDFVDGESLAKRIEDRGAVPEDEVLAWADQLLDALAYCHSQGVIHRDVKPQNVIVRPDGQAVLVDFGLVKLWDPNDPHTKTVMQGMGTPGYAPPEQYGIQPGHTDPRSDVYSVGATLYHALAGQAPLPAADRMSDPDQFVSPRGLNPRVSSSTEAAVLRAMELSLADRFQSAPEMAAALRSRAYIPARPAVRPRPPIPAWAWVLGVVAAVVLVTGVVVATVAGMSLAGGRSGPTSVPLSAAAVSPENADQVGRLARWGEGTVNAVAFSPDGRLLAVASSVGVYLYDAETLEEVCFIDADAGVDSVAFSPDGATVASASEWQQGVYVWRAADGALLRTLRAEEWGTESMAFSPDGSVLAVGFWQTVHLWRVSDGELLRTLEGHTSQVNSVAFSPDGATLASGSSDETVRIWRVSDGVLLHVHMLEGHTDDVTSMAFSPDGATLASGSRDEMVRLWRVSDGALLRTLEGHTNLVESVAFSPDGSVLASGSWGEVRLWRMPDGALLWALEGHAKWVNSVAFSPDGATLASASDDEAVRLWQVSDGTLLHTLDEYTGAVLGVAFSSDGAMLASASDDGMVRLWRVADRALLRVLEGDESIAHSVAFSPDGATLASASGHEVRLWGSADGALLRSLRAEKWPWGAVSVAFSLDGATLASGSQDGTIQLWQISDGTVLRTLEGHTKRVSSVAFSPDGAMLASASWDGTVRLWRVDPGPLQRSFLRTLEGHTDEVQSVVFSPDGATLASASDDGTVRLWRVADGSLLYAVDERANSVAFSPDGVVLVSGSYARMRLWQVADGALLCSLWGHTGDVNSVAFSPDGALLASGSDDGTVRLWGLMEQ